MHWIHSSIIFLEFWSRSESRFAVCPCDLARDFLEVRTRRNLLKQEETLMVTNPHLRILRIWTGCDLERFAAMNPADCQALWMRHSKYDNRGVLNDNVRCSRIWVNGEVKQMVCFCIFSRYWYCWYWYFQRGAVLSIVSNWQLSNWQIVGCTVGAPSHLQLPTSTCTLAPSH